MDGWAGSGGHRLGALCDAQLAAWMPGSLAPSRIRPPAWWLVWLWAAPFLSAGIPLITMTVNSPVLPPTLALACTIAALVGVGFALLPGEWAATQPMALAWLTAESVGLMPALLLVRTVELPDRGISVSPALAWTVAIGGFLAGSAWLGGMSVLRHRWGRGPTQCSRPVRGGICLSYLFLPLVHHLLATPPGFLYISTASKFSAFDFGLQVVAMTIAAGMAVGVTWLRSGTHRLR